MDSRRFDAISRTLAERRTRRQAVRHLAGGGLSAGMAAGLAEPRTLRAAQAGPCVLHLHAETATGPNLDAVYDGELSLDIDDDGNIDRGAFMTQEGSFDVVGQTSGRGLNLRIELENDQALTLIGTGEQDIILCRGEMQGEFGGPLMKDLGTWTATSS
jgi:hypothetical protein